MHSDTQILGNMSITPRASLTRAVGIYFGKIDSPLPAHPIQNSNKLTKTCIKSVLAQHPLGHGFQVQIFGKNHSGVVTQTISNLEMIVLPGVSNLLVQSANLLLKFQPIFRTFLLVFESALRGNKAGSRATPLFALAIPARVAGKQKI